MPDKQDPDEFLKAHGRDEFLKVINENMPLKDLLWKKNADAVPTNTPEQKALLEKNIKDDVAKIADEAVRGYYIQDMKSKIYHEIGRGSWQPYDKKTRNYNKNDKVTVSLAGTIKTNLDDLVAEYVVSALISYPSLIAEYEEKLLNFNIKNDKLRDLYEYLLDMLHNEQEFNDTENLLKVLHNNGFEEVLKKQIELSMLRKQCPDIIKMRKNLDERII